MLKDIAYYGFSSTKYLSGVLAVNKPKSCSALEDVRSAILQDCTRQGNVEDVAVARLLLWTVWKKKSK